MAWVGPFTIRALLEGCQDERQRPPGGDGVYVISLKRWYGTPEKGAGILYVGGNTGKSARFRTRIGDLLADMFGFFCGTTGHHSGGQTIWKYCHRSRISPMGLWIGWQTEVGCKRCAEIELYEQLRPELNKKRPSACSVHRAGNA